MVWAAALFATACWAAYAAYAASNWEWFASDMQFQFGQKESLSGLAGGAGARALYAGRLIPNLVLVTCALFAARFGLTTVWRLLALALPMQLLSWLALGWMYEIYAALGALLICFAALECVAHALSRTPGFEAGPRRTGAIAASTFVLCGSAAVLVSCAPVFTKSARRVEAEQKLDPRPEYFTREDRRAIEEFLGSLGDSAQPLSVQFFPTADALLVRELESENVQFLQPTFHRERSDVYVLHRSAAISRTLRISIDRRLAMREGVRPQGDHWRPIQARGATERWLVHRRGHANARTTMQR